MVLERRRTDSIGERRNKKGGEAMGFERKRGVVRCEVGKR